MYFIEIIYLCETFPYTLLDLCQTSIETVENTLKIICWKEMFTFLINTVVLDTPFCSLLAQIMQYLYKTYIL